MRTNRIESLKSFISELPSVYLTHLALAALRAISALFLAVRLLSPSQSAFESAHGSQGDSSGVFVRLCGAFRQLNDASERRPPTAHSECVPKRS